MRYKFYREHKYVSFRFNELERLIAQTDFTSDDALQNVKIAFDALIELLEGHAHYENNMLHPLLKKKNSAVYQQIEAEHDHFNEEVIFLRNLLDKIGSSASRDDKIEAGYQFYLQFRKFVGENLIHLHEEETIILPELQRLYADDELRQVEIDTYHRMTPEQMVHMLEALFPHMNIHDREVFLHDIQSAEPEKFTEVWHHIRKKLSPEEQEYFVAALKIEVV